MKTLQANREARGWSRAELARRAGLNATTVGLVEAGRLIPYPGQLQKLATALGLHSGHADQLMAEVAASGQPVEV